MTLEEFRLRFRQGTGDLSKPYLWSDEEVDQFANDAEDEACRRAGLLVDSSSPEASEIVISARDEAVDLHESVIFVRRARLASSGRTLSPRVARAMDEECPGWEDTPASIPQIFVPDWESGKLRLWPPAAQADTLKLTVVRTPLVPMEKDGDSPSIPRRYHAALLDWMYHLAYLKQDADAFDPKKAAQHEGRFTAEFGPPSSAIDEHWAAEQYYDVGNR